MLDEQDITTGYCSYPVVPQDVQGNITPGVNTNLDSAMETDDEDKDEDFDGAILTACFSKVMTRGFPGQVLN